ncbi:MAG: carboxypeptidase regulatory-like domain-containing protein, partial [Bryobacteraceae bacterium]
KWNAIVQRELPWNMSVEVGYEGNHQAHQVYLTNTDYAGNLGTINSSISSATLQEIQPECPPPTCVSPGNGLSMTLSNGYGNYAAGTVKLEKRYSKGLQFLAAYTWSHALADSGTPLSGGANFGVPYAPNQGSAYASAAWDIRHSFTTGFNYDLPFGRGKQFGGNMPKAADYVVGQWHLNGILTLRTGQPFSFNGASCQGVWNKCSPDIVPGYTANQAPSGGRNANEWFDPAAYAVAAPLTGGDLGQAAGTGPPTETLDFSTFKDFALTERFKMQFRGEFINLFNFPLLSQPDASLGDSKALGGNGNFGVITGATVGSERHIQFSLRLSF